MIPSFTSNNVLDRGFHTSVLFGKNPMRSLECFVFSANSQYLFFCKSGFWMVPLTKSLASSFSAFIIGIVRSRPKEQVTRIATSRVVAFMKHAKIIWDFAKCKLIRYPSRRNRLVVDAKPSISESITASGPNPALIRRTPFHLFPKTISHGATRLIPKQFRYPAIVFTTTSFGFPCSRNTTNFTEYGSRIRNIVHQVIMRKRLRFVK